MLHVAPFLGRLARKIRLEKNAYADVNVNGEIAHVAYGVFG